MRTSDGPFIHRFIYRFADISGFFLVTGDEWPRQRRNEGQTNFQRRSRPQLRWNIVEKRKVGWPAARSVTRTVKKVIIVRLRLGRGWRCNEPAFLPRKICEKNIWTIPLRSEREGKGSFTELREKKSFSISWRRLRFFRKKQGPISRREERMLRSMGLPRIAHWFLGSRAKCLVAGKFAEEIVQNSFVTVEGGRSKEKFKKCAFVVNLTL